MTVHGDFPSIKVHLQDKAHAATRLTMTSWSAAPFLKAHSSQLPRTKRTDMFKHVFNDRIAQTVDIPVYGERVRDLQKPMCRQRPAT